MPLGSFQSYADWNKINQEDSSVQGYDSNQQNDFMETASPTIMKIVSQPERTSKILDSKPSLNDVIQQNLQKLSLIQSQQIWLFIPKPYKYQNLEEINKIVKQLQKTKKILPNISGWNVLVNNKADAKQYILNGYKKNRIFLKFYISTKNYDSNLQENSNNRKGSTQNMDFNNSYQTPHKQKVIKYEDQSSKKKVKYLEKRIEQRNKVEDKINDQKLSINENQKQQVQSKNIQKNEVINISNDVDKSEKIIQQKRTLHHLQVHTIPDLTNIQQQKMQNETLKMQPDRRYIQNEVNEILSDQKANEDQNQINSSEQQIQQEYDSEQSLQRMKRAIKRKNKKLKKKLNSNSQSNSLDQNNPFSILTK